MKNNSRERIEEDQAQILDTVRVENGRRHGGLLHVGDVVLGRDERRGERGRRLEHEADHEDHAHARHNVGVILYDELVAQIRRRRLAARAARARSLSSHTCTHFFVVVVLTDDLYL